jgi:hypothetical protein
MAILKAIGQYLTHSQLRKVVFCTYSRVTHDFLGCDVHRQPSQCTMDTVCGIWVSSQGSYAGFHETAAAFGDSSEKDRVANNKGKDSLYNDKENPVG